MDFVEISGFNRSSILIRSEFIRIIFHLFFHTSRVLVSEIDARSNDCVDYAPDHQNIDHSFMSLISDKFRTARRFTCSFERNQPFLPLLAPFGPRVAFFSTETFMLPHKTFALLFLPILLQTLY